MATENRRTDPVVTAPAQSAPSVEDSIEDILYKEGYRFDFFQAVRILERLYPHRQPVGQNAELSQEVVRFRSHLSLSFPPSAIHNISRPEDKEAPAHMTVAFMGLTGPLGVLPRHYTELLLERVRNHKDYALYDFLDLFNHRLISLFYRAWEKYRIPIAYERAALQRKEDSFSLYLFDLIGMGTKGLRGRQEIQDRSLLFYAGLLAQRPRSASALAGLLSDYFGVVVEVVQFIGQWLPLIEANRSCLGPREGNNALGLNTIAGSRVWDQQAKFRLRLGPLSKAEFYQFLPSGKAFQLLVQLSRFFAGQECDFDVQPIVKHSEVPGCYLGGKKGERTPQLGWSAWLKTREFTHDAEDAIFAVRQRSTVTY